MKHVDMKIQGLPTLRQFNVSKNLKKFVEICLKVIAILPIHSIVENKKRFHSVLPLVFNFHYNVKYQCSTTEKFVI